MKTKVFQVEAGLLRNFPIDEKGKEPIYELAPENWILADSTSPQKPAELFIDALEDSLVIQRGVVDNKFFLFRLHKLFA